MKLIRLGDTDKLENVIVFYFEVKEPHEEYIKEAKELDGENYIDDCFGFCLNYDLLRNKFNLITEQDDELYYIDNTGYKNYLLGSSITKEILEKAKEIAREQIV